MERLAEKGLDLTGSAKPLVEIANSVGAASSTIGPSVSVVEVQVRGSWGYSSGAADNREKTNYIQWNPLLVPRRMLG